MARELAAGAGIGGGDKVGLRAGDFGRAAGVQGVGAAAVGGVHSLATGARRADRNFNAGGAGGVGVAFFGGTGGGKNPPGRGRFCAAGGG